jgi:hypothetical protein
MEGNCEKFFTVCEKNGMVDSVLMVAAWTCQMGILTVFIGRLG